MNGRRPKPENRLAALLAAGPTDAEGRLRRAILTALTRAKRPLSWQEISRALRQSMALSSPLLDGARETLQALEDDGMLVRKTVLSADERSRTTYWDLTS